MLTWLAFVLYSSAGGLVLSLLVWGARAESRRWSASLVYVLTGLLAFSVFWWTLPGKVEMQFPFISQFFYLLFYAAAWIVLAFWLLVAYLVLSLLGREDYELRSRLYFRFLWIITAVALADGLALGYLPIRRIEYSPPSALTESVRRLEQTLAQRRVEAFWSQDAAPLRFNIRPQFKPAYTLGTPKTWFVDENTYGSQGGLSSFLIWKGEVLEVYSITAPGSKLPTQASLEKPALLNLIERAGLALPWNWQRSTALEVTASRFRISENRKVIQLDVDLEDSSRWTVSPSRLSLSINQRNFDLP